VSTTRDTLFTTSPLREGASLFMVWIIRRMINPITRAAAIIKVAMITFPLAVDGHAKNWVKIKMIDWLSVLAGKSLLISQGKDSFFEN